MILVVGEVFILVLDEVFRKIGPRPHTWSLKMRTVCDYHGDC